MFKFYDVNPIDAYGIDHKEKINYEKYIVDFINNSKYFDNYGTFKHVEEQSHSESDITSVSGYSIDFKTFALNSEIIAKKCKIIFEEKNDKLIFKIKEPISKKEEYLVLRYFLSNFTNEDFLEILKNNKFKNISDIKNSTFRLPNILNNIIYTDDDKLEIIRYVKNIFLNDSKNILFYYPIICTLETNKEDILEGLNNVLGKAFCFREKHIKKDTYFALFKEYENSFSFLIYTFKNNKFELISEVDIKNTKKLTILNNKFLNATVLNGCTIKIPKKNFI